MSQELGRGAEAGGGSLALQGNCSESRAQPLSDIRIFWPLQNTLDGQATANATLNTKTSLALIMLFCMSGIEMFTIIVDIVFLSPSFTIHVIVRSTHDTFMGDSVRITFPFPIKNFLLT